MVIKVLLLYFMIFCHIVDDYYLQGVLASMKQKEWWKKNAPDELYGKDYIMALIMHGISWSFMVNLPLIVYGLLQGNERVLFACLVMVPFHAICHASIDNEKANVHSINLIMDQIFHIIQILVIWTTITIFIV